MTEYHTSNEINRESQKPKKPPKETFDWTRSSDGFVTCFDSKRSKCFIYLTPASVLSTIHDQHLEEATAQINSILDKLQNLTKTVQNL